MDLVVTAFDSYNNRFDDDQYQHMNFNIEIEISQLRVRGLSAERDPLDNRKFLAKGQEPGNYQVSAFSFRQPTGASGEKQRVTSEVLKIEVFPLLEIYPSSLLLTPSMKYTLQIVGGPIRGAISGDSVEIKFEVENKQVASVDQHREVTGLEIGDTNLYYEIIQIKADKGDSQRRSIVSKKTVPIRVRLVTGIEIPFNNQRTVYSGSMIKLLAILKY